MGIGKDEVVSKILLSLDSQSFMVKYNCSKRD